MNMNNASALKVLKTDQRSVSRDIVDFDDALAELGITLPEWLEAARKQWTCAWPWKLPNLQGDEGEYVMSRLHRSHHGVWFGHWAQYPAHKWDCGVYATVTDLVIGVWQIFTGDVERFGMFIPNRYDRYDGVVPVFVGTADECDEWMRGGAHPPTIRMGVAGGTL